MNGPNRESSDADVRVSRMKAAPGEPWLSVHAIAEYAFCPRAGLLAYENKRGDVDDEPPSFDTLPTFELQAIENEIARRRQLMFRWIYFLIMVTLPSPVAAHFQQYWLLALGFVAMAFASYQIVNTMVNLLTLLRRRNDALTSRCAEPDPSSEQLQSVNWFGMFHHGFESQILKESLRDIEWQFDGRPWRVLRKGSLAIPVFRTRSPMDRPNEQHIAKIMAYCRLSTFCFGHDCPYGIILTGEDYSGFAVPNHPSFRKRFHDSLVELRHLSQAADQRSDGFIPIDERKCSNCPLGKPRLVYLGQRIHRFGAPIQVNRSTGWKGNDVHSDCGDRFEWTPPFIGDSGNR